VAGLWSEHKGEAVSGSGSCAAAYHYVKLGWGRELPLLCYTEPTATTKAREEKEGGTTGLRLKHKGKAVSRWSNLDRASPLTTASS
jgi:hypothetical protein